jgi:hypothetical protein
VSSCDEVYGGHGRFRHSQVVEGPDVVPIRFGDDGWFDILWRLCVDLEPLVAEFEQETGSQFEVL